MAAELEQLIHAYRRHGLHEASAHLAVTKAELEARGLLPPALTQTGPDLRGGQYEEMDASERRIADRITVFAGGLVVGSIREHPDLAEQYEVDTLGLSVRQRNALVRSGLTTIAAVRYFAKYDLLQHVAHIGIPSAEQITDRLRQIPLSPPTDS